MPHSLIIELKFVVSQGSPPTLLPLCFHKHSHSSPTSVTSHSLLHIHLPFSTPPLFISSSYSYKHPLPLSYYPPTSNSQQRHSLLSSSSYSARRHSLLFFLSLLSASYSAPLHRQNEKTWRNNFSSSSFNSVPAHGKETGWRAWDGGGRGTEQVFIISWISISPALAFITGNTMAPANALNTLSPVFFQDA